LILSGLLVAAYVRCERILVMNVLGRHESGIYYAAARFADVWVSVPGLILSSLYPLMVEWRRLSADRYAEAMQRTFDLLTGLGLAVAVGATVFGPWALALLFGSEYRAAGVILAIQAWSAPVVFSGAVRAQYFLLEQLTVYHIVSALLGIAMNVVLALSLMPRWGAVGAAVGAVAGYWTAGYATSWCFPRLRACGRMQTRGLSVVWRAGAVASWVLQTLRAAK
jgi:O-antigen/teichoic acid export membrane protein